MTNRLVKESWMRSVLHVTTRSSHENSDALRAAKCALLRQVKP